MATVEPIRDINDLKKLRMSYLKMKEIYYFSP